MSAVIFWIKQHKVSSILFIIILFLLFRNDLPISSRSQSMMYKLPSIGGSESNQGNLRVSSAGLSAPDINIFPESAPAPEESQRMVVSESSLSLIVKSVSEIQKQITSKASELGGYMISSNLENPSDVATATVIVRVPIKQFDAALDFFKSLSLKVVSENLSGIDVTDQYVDLDARLDTLNKTKAKFESILNSATAVTDILNVQRELINLQSQIDSIKGQQKYLEKTAENAKITVYLSTDEMALPYTPSEVWRPAVIFKQAVRSLIELIRSIGSLIIWIVVYSIIWIPIFLIVIFLKHRSKKRI